MKFIHNYHEIFHYLKSNQNKEALLSRINFWFEVKNYKFPLNTGIQEVINVSDHNHSVFHLKLFLLIQRLTNI